jgi:hypothetical protein
MEPYAALNLLALGGVLGVVGQAIRVIPGLKKLNDAAASAGMSVSQCFSPVVFWTSILIGFVAGTVAMLVSPAFTTGTVDKATIMTLIAAGYAGADFIEAFVKQYLPSPKPPGAAAVSAPSNAPQALTPLQLAQTPAHNFLALTPAIEDQNVAVASAVALQLQAEGRWPPNDVNKVMADDYKYTLVTISKFLSCVSTRLAANVPSFKFNFDQPFANSCLPLNVVEVIAAVNGKTTS